MEPLPPLGFDEFLSSESARAEYWRRKFELDDPLRGAEPNRGHRAIAELVRRGTASAVVTQNVDGMHQKSGVPGDQVIELHGNASYAKCLDCEMRYKIEPLRPRWEADHDITCDACNGLIKSATISFGQAMPEAEMNRASIAAYECDLMLVLGSSLVVYPAASIPMIAKQNGAAFAIINREPTDQDRMADLVLNTGIGPTMTEALAKLKS